MTGACLTVSQVQSIPWAAAPSSASLLLVTSVFVTPIVTRGECRKALYELGCSSGRSARLFRMKEAGEGRRGDQPTDWLLHDYCAAWAILTTAFRRKAPGGGAGLRVQQTNLALPALLHRDDFIAATVGRRCCYRPQVCHQAWTGEGAPLTTIAIGLSASTP